MTEHPEHPEHDDLHFPRAEEALKTLLPTLQQLPGADVQPFRMPVPEAVAAIHRCAGAFAEDRPRFAATFKPEAFRVEDHDDLVLRAQALWRADLQLRQATEGKGFAPEVIAKAEPLRQKLLKAADYLWAADAVLGEQVAAIREGRSHVDIADELAALAGIFDSHWGYAKGRCDVTEADLEQARNFANRIIHALAKSAASIDAADREIARLRDLRDRAATHAQKGVDMVRAAAAFIFRDQPDAFDRYPSVYQGRGARARRKAGNEPRPAPTGGTTATEGHNTGRASS